MSFYLNGHLEINFQGRLDRDGTILIGTDRYRVLSSVYEKFTYCTNAKEFTEAIELFAFKCMNIKNGIYDPRNSCLEQYFEKL